MYLKLLFDFYHLLCCCGTTTFKFQYKSPTILHNIMYFYLNSRKHRFSKCMLGKCFSSVVKKKKKIILSRFGIEIRKWQWCWYNTTEPYTII